MPTGLVLCRHFCIGDIMVTSLLSAALVFEFWVASSQDWVNAGPSPGNLQITAVIALTAVALFCRVIEDTV